MFNLGRRPRADEQVSPQSPTQVKHDLLKKKLKSKLSFIILVLRANGPLEVLKGICKVTLTSRHVLFPLTYQFQDNDAVSAMGEKSGRVKEGVFGTLRANYLLLIKY